MHPPGVDSPGRARVPNSHAGTERTPCARVGELTHTTPWRTFAWLQRIPTERSRRPMSKESARWVSNSDVIPMFPTLVWKARLEPQLRKDIDSQVLAVLARLRGPLPPLAPGHGWQSIQTLHR